jgi:hypothetical protein
MDDWAWGQLERWLAVRVELPVGPLFCVLAGARGRTLRPASSCGIPPRSPACGADSPPISSATPRRRDGARRRLTDRHRTPARTHQPRPSPRSTSRASTVRDHRHRPRPPSASRPRRQLAKSLTTAGLLVVVLRTSQPPGLARSLVPRGRTVQPMASMSKANRCARWRIGIWNAGSASTSANHSPISAPPSSPPQIVACRSRTSSAPGTKMVNNSPSCLHTRRPCVSRLARRSARVRAAVESHGRRVVETTNPSVARASGTRSHPMRVRIGDREAASLYTAA